MTTPEHVDGAHAAETYMEATFRALADPTRRKLLDQLHQRDGQTLGELCAGFHMARQSVTKHIAVLEEANLITTVWRGRQKLHYLNPAPINDLSDRWIHRYVKERVEALADLKSALEGNTMQRPQFVYKTYIHTTPEELWEALTNPAFTQRYWGVTFESDWLVGSTITLKQNGVTIADPAQVVLESEPGRRLAYTWHTFTPEWAESHGFSEDLRRRLAAERRSKVTFDIEPVGEVVKLTVVHDGFDPGSTVAEMVSEGWPQVLSELKTLLESAAKQPSGAPAPTPLMGAPRVEQR